MGLHASKFAQNVHSVTTSGSHIFHYGTKKHCDACKRAIHGGYTSWDEAFANPKFLAEVTANLMDDNYVTSILCDGSDIKNGKLS